MLVMVGASASSDPPADHREPCRRRDPDGAGRRFAAQNDLAVPLIAVHMFVFYFGLMADVSPPVGLAAYAAAAIAGADPMKVGWQGTWYEFRNLLALHLHLQSRAAADRHRTRHLFAVVGSGTVAMMAFNAALQGFFFARNRWWETVVLLVIYFTLFRPHFWMEMVAPQFRNVPATDILRVVDATPATERLVADRNHRSRRSGHQGGPTGAWRERDDAGAPAATGPTVSGAQMQPKVASVRLARRRRACCGRGTRSPLSVPNERPSPFLARSRRWRR